MADNTSVPPGMAVVELRVSPDGDGFVIEFVAEGRVMHRSEPFDTQAEALEVARGFAKQMAEAAEKNGGGRLH